MPLAYNEEAGLTIPDTAYNADDVATILVTGARYGGQWSLAAFPVMFGVPDYDTALGKIWTEKDERPSMAVDTALVWINDACVKTGVKMAHVENLNYTYDAESAPYMASAVFVIDRRNV